MKRRPGLAVSTLTLAALATGGAIQAAAPEPDAPDIVLVTLDTTRADRLGAYGARPSATPVLDGLAARGVRFEHALTAAPLTLPAHASLLTGLAPPEHGLRDNGIARLPEEVPLVAEVLEKAGYSTAAFVASRVLDRRFGLDRGFAVYDDRMTAERVGEYGYPERDAAAVTGAALEWASGHGRSPYFLWVHYYDPHAPYEPPGADTGAPAGERYLAEIAYVDSELGRLLDSLPGKGEERLVAVVADHGEMLGEHGERAHGIFLYEASLRVPLLLAGAGLPAATTVPGSVAIRHLAGTLARLAGAPGAEALGDSLPGLDLPGEAKEEAVFSETWLPATAYGWSALKAVTSGDWRLIAAPRPELYDLAADPAESRNLFAEEQKTARRLARRLRSLEEGFSTRQPASLADGSIAQELRSLGYLSGASGSRSGDVDPKDGILWLGELEKAKALLAARRGGEAVRRLEELVAKSPGNVPFLTRLAQARAAVGQMEAAESTLRRALGLNPGLDLLHLQLGDLYFRLSRWEEAEAAYETALELNPRLAGAWMGLAELAHRSGRPEEERAILERALASDTASAAVHTRMAQLELSAGDLAAATLHAAEATRLLPRLAPAWWIAGRVAEATGKRQEAIDAFSKAVELAPSDPGARLALARTLMAAGRPEAARPHLQEVLLRAPGSPAAREARRLLEGEAPRR